MRPALLRRRAVPQATAQRQPRTATTAGTASCNSSNTCVATCGSGYRRWQRVHSLWRLLRVADEISLQHAAKVVAGGSGAGRSARGQHNCLRARSLPDHESPHARRQRCGRAHSLP